MHIPSTIHTSCLHVPCMSHVLCQRCCCSFSSGFLMVSLLFSSSFFVGVSIVSVICLIASLRFCVGFLYLFLIFSYGLSTISLKISSGVPGVLLSFSRCFLRTFKRSLKFSFGFPVVSLRGLPRFWLNFPMTSLSFLKVFNWFGYGLPKVSLRLPGGFP